MKIALISREYPPDTEWGGVSFIYYNMAVALSGNGHEVHVICQATGKPGDFVDNKVEVHRVGTKPERYSAIARINYTISAWLKLRKLIRNQNVEIVCASHWGAEGFLCCLFEHVPLVITTHTSAQEILKNKTYASKKEYLSLKVLSIFENITLKRATRVIANSLDINNHIIRDIHIPKENIDLIHHATDTVQFTPAISVVSIRRELEIPDNEQVILCIGRLEQRKGTHIMGEAIPKILECKPETRYIFVGKDTETAPGGGSFKRYLLNKAEENGFLDKITFFDSVSQKKLIRLYQTCDVYVSASLQESFGLTVIEAMACGKPVVATLTGIVPELAAFGLEGLRAVPAGDAEKLAEAINYFLSLPKEDTEKLGMANRHFIEKEFSLAAWTDKTIRVFEKTIQNRTF